MKSNFIFTANSKDLINGYIYIEDNIIKYIGSEKPQLEKEFKLYDLNDQLICPGFVDTHCFFTGYYLIQFAEDISNIKSLNELNYEVNINSYDVVIFKNIYIDDFKENYLNRFDKPVVIINFDEEKCFLNDNAKERFKFDNKNCYSEGYWRLLQHILNLPIANEFFINYMKMLNSKGITSIKEMGFDDYYGFTNTLSNLKNNNLLTTRVHFMSQPVGSDINIEYGVNMKKEFNDNYLTFSGFNQMTDGSLSQFEADLKQPYKNTNITCKKEIDWNKVEKDTLKADSEDIRFSLHAQGDAAIKKCIDIYDKCKKESSGKLKNRHAITDLEFSDKDDFKKMGELGVIAEIYPQIMSLANRKDKLDMIEEKIGFERGKNYWNRRAMVDNNVIVSCATDLPLLVDDIPESIYNSVYGLFNNDVNPFNKQNTLAIFELLTSWTLNGQYNLGKENILGTLEVGKFADISVLNKNVFNVDVNDLKDVFVSMTIFDGKIVYKKI